MIFVIYVVKEGSCCVVTHALWPIISSAFEKTSTPLTRGHVQRVWMKLCCTVARILVEVVVVVVVVVVVAAAVSSIPMLKGEVKVKTRSR